MTAVVSIYSLYSLFVFYQQLQVKNFRGASQQMHFVLSAFALLGMLFGIGFLAYYGYRVSWLGAGVLFLAAFAVKIVWFFFEAKLGIRGLAAYISLAGFVAIPVLGYLLWASIPA